MLRGCYLRSRKREQEQSVALANLSNVLLSKSCISSSGASRWLYSLPVEEVGSWFVWVQVKAFDATLSPCRNPAEDKPNKTIDCKTRKGNPFARPSGTSIFAGVL